MSEIRMSENQKCPIARQNFLNKTKFTFQAVVAEWVSMCQSIPLANAQGGGFKSERFPLHCTTYNLILLVFTCACVSDLKRFVSLVEVIGQDLSCSEWLMVMKSHGHVRSHPYMGMYGK